MLTLAFALLACTRVPPKDITNADTAVVDGDDVDGDGFTAAEGDCADEDAATFPGADEACDGRDNDCDTEVDEDAIDAAAWYADADSDGFGDAASGVRACEAPANTVADATDCDDAAAEVNPAAQEACNGVDDDCDAEVDEDAADAAVWYADADADGFGDGGAALLACAAPVGTVADATDCDDAAADVSPAGTETCDGRDEDCDGTVDEDDALDAPFWYADADGDGWGDAGATTQACTAPAGTVDLPGDCDDDASDVSPDGLETCDDRDEDCDGTVDEDDAIDAVEWYADADADGFGDAGTTARACEPPASTVADATDCDDDASDVYPGAPETCDGRDEDCDGTVDEDDALDAGTWYVDADGDGYGDDATALAACGAPAGTIATGGDCDDTDATAYPGAPEWRDGRDDNCDGDADEELHRGSGADGDLSVSGTVDLSTWTSAGRPAADAVAYGVTAIGSDSVQLDAAATGLAPGDEVLIVNLQGSDTRYANVGGYAFATVSAVSGDVVELADTLGVVLGETSNADLTDQVIVLQRVPNYANVTVAAGGTLTTALWDGAQGGVLAFRAYDTLQVADGGAVSVSSLGYAGGATGLSYNCDSFQGESYNGPGDGAAYGTCAAYNESYGLWANNGGGGGAHICGGGGEHGGGATATDSWNGGSATPAQAGTPYGSDDLGTVFFGSGGGGVWQGLTTCTGSGPGPGGDGGGILLVGAGEIELAGADAMLAEGGSTTACARGTWTYGAGGGAGGTVWLAADRVSLAADSVDARGGFGEARNERRGGDGGQGRVRLDCATCNGFAAGSAEASAALAAASAPDVGFSATP